MKKLLALILILSMNLVIFFFWQSSTIQADENGPIPKNAIRLRILANSDAPADQVVKRQVRDAVNSRISGWVSRLKSPAQAGREIRRRMPELRRTVARTLRDAHADPVYQMKLGRAQFPTKVYGDYVYPAGKYEALVISLGDGKGANWWCVLFPPLCFLDFSNSEAVKTSDRPAISQEAHDKKPPAVAKKKPRTDRADGNSEKKAVQKSMDDDKPAASRTAREDRAAAEKTAAADREQTEAAPKQQVKVRFFVVDAFSQFWHMLTN